MVTGRCFRSSSPILCYGSKCVYPSPVDLLPSLAAIGLLLAFIWQAALGFTAPTVVADELFMTRMPLGSTFNAGVILMALRAFSSVGLVPIAYLNHSLL